MNRVKGEAPHAVSAAAAMNLKTLRDNIRFARFGRSAGFVFLKPCGPCTVIPPPDSTPRARDGMHVAVTFWSCHGIPIFEVDAQSLN